MAKKKAYRYTCANCKTEQVFRPGDPERRDLTESVGAKTEEDVFWPVCPKCNAQNRIKPENKS